MIFLPHLCGRKITITISFCNIQPAVGPQLDVYLETLLTTSVTLEYFDYQCINIPTRR